jgi:signal transduction histidine kinase
VALWEHRGESDSLALLAREPETAPLPLDPNTALRAWGVPVVPGTRWLGCRLGDTGEWHLAPVRSRIGQPPSGVERRAAARVTLDLAATCLGLMDVQADTTLPPGTGADALTRFGQDPGVIAHEVANPLVVSLASTELCIAAVREHELKEDMRAGLLQDLGAIETGIHKAVGYLRAIQSRTRRAYGEDERFDAVKVVQSCVTLERSLARRRRTDLVVDTSVESMFLRGDPSAMYQVLTNLIRNAVHASSGRGPVTVALARDANALYVRIKDRGTGIAPEHVRRLFERGFTTKPHGEGTGMGLTIVKEITERVFGGTIHLESTDPQGSVFVLALPAPPQRTPDAP